MLCVCVYIISKSLCTEALIGALSYPLLLLMTQGQDMSETHHLKYVLMACCHDEQPAGYPVSGMYCDMASHNLSSPCKKTSHVLVNLLSTVVCICRLCKQLLQHSSTTTVSLERLLSSNVDYQKRI